MALHTNGPVLCQGFERPCDFILLIQAESRAKLFILKDTYHNVDWATNGEIYGLLQDHGWGSRTEDPLGAGGEQGLPVFISEEVAPLVPKLSVQTGEEAPLHHL